MKNVLSYDIYMRAVWEQSIAVYRTWNRAYMEINVTGLGSLI